VRARDSARNGDGQRRCSGRRSDCGDSGHTSINTDACLDIPLELEGGFAGANYGLMRQGVAVGVRPHRTLALLLFGAQAALVGALKFKSRPPSCSPGSRASAATAGGETWLDLFRLM
jgi:hypothetical protein